MFVKRKIGELRVSELRTELEKRKLDNKGLKSILLQRLQKAIIDEGGDLDQIEIEIVAAGPGSTQKKSSPRIKRITEQSTDTDDDSATAVKVTSEPSDDQEKSVQASNNNLEDAAGDASTFDKVDNESEKQEKQAEHQTESEENIPGSESVPDQENLPVVEETASNQSTTTLDIVSSAADEPIDDENALIVKDEVTEDSDDDENEDDYDYNNDGEEAQNLDTFDSAVHDDLDEAGDAVEDANPDNLPTALEDEHLSEQQNDESCEHQDPELKDEIDENEIDEASKSGDEENSMAMEDDVLDMLDYDIEMPDHSQAEHGNSGNETLGDNDDTIPADAKTSEDIGNKDSSVASESSKDDDPEKALKNLWITGLGATTRASELKVAFSRYGKVVGAKVVTSARSPGAKCYGFVAMSTAEAAKKCIIHLHKTELHGRMITVEHTKNDPSAKRAPRMRSAEEDDLISRTSRSPDKDNISSRKTTGDPSKEATGEDSKRISSESGGRIRRHDDIRPGEKRLRKSPLERSRSGARLLRRPGDRRAEPEPFRKRPRLIGERKVVIDNQRGEMSLRVNVRSSQDGRRPVLRRISHSPLRTVRSSRIEDRLRRPDGRTIAHEHARARERDLRELRSRELRARDAREEISRRKASNQRPTRSMALQASIERDRQMLRKEKEERNFLRMERERLERERRQLERDRLERERLEQERIKLEQERKRELEKIEREKEEMKRLQDINRFEQSQRQRALKRMYDGRPHDDRADGKRTDRDDRRRYEGESRDRHGGPPDAFYRNEEGGYRPRGGAPGRLEGSGRLEKVDYHDVDRRNLSHNDTDARYSGGRRVEKYERPSLTSDRRGTDGIGGNLSYRHHDKDVGDDRKVVPRDRGRPTSGAYRRDEPSLAKKEAMSLRTSAARARTGDRDLREEIRQGPPSSARKGSPHHSDLRHRDEPHSGRPGPRGTADPPPAKYQDRAHPEPSMHSSTGMQSGPPSGKPIPTTGRSGMPFQPSSAWPAWHGPNPLPTGGGPVGRMVAPMGLPFNPMTAVNAPPSMGGDGGVMGHGIPSTFTQSRMDNNFKPVRRF